MSNYSVGNLELSIQALDNTTTSFNNVISRLSTMMGIVKELSTAFRGLGQINTFANGLAKIAKIDLKPVADNIQKIPEVVKPLNNLGIGFKGLGQLTNFANGLNKIAKVNTPDVYKKINSIVRTVTPLQGFGESFKGLGQLTNFANGLKKIEKLDMSVIDKQLKSLTETLRPFLNELSVATPSLTAFSNAMGSLKGRRTISFKQFETNGTVNKDISKTLNLAGVLGKLYFIRNYTKQIGRGLANLVQSAIDYTETLNLWQVAMRGNVDTAEEFISKMNKAYGIAEQTLMKYQATFSNMLSTLGGVSSDVSYALSEYLTQMALDYASLYNTSIDKAMTVFQSVLSGQVRPIRSISGYDITETTIFQLYQELGGTKTMRQLSQTEKRLLRIYAVFQQMDRSGAIGDLNKTLNNTANQVRILKEALTELGTWLGKMAEVYIAPLLPYMNALLITAKNIAQAIAKSLPNYSEFDGTIAGYEDVADAMDEVQGKLLDFDKFRSLSGTETDFGLGIDDSLIQGLKDYQSILENVNNKATELAEKWTSFFIDTETGELAENTERILALLMSVFVVAGLILSYRFAPKIIEITASITGLTSALSLLNATLGVGIIYTFVRAFQLFREGNILGGILATTVGVVLVGAFIALNKEALITFWQTLGKKVIPMVMSAILSFGGLRAMVLATASSAVTFGVAFMGAWAILSLLPEGAQKVVGGIMLIAGAFIALTTAILAYKSVLTWGTALPILSASVGAALAGGMAWAGQLNTVANSVQVRKDGGLIEDGLFTMNKGEVMGTFDDGSTIVANNQQIISGIKQGVYQAVSQAMKNNLNNDGRPIEILIDGEKVFQVTSKNAKRHGVGFSKL